MLGAWFRSALLLGCRIAGGARGLSRRRLVFHVLLLAGVAGALRGVDAVAAARARAPDRPDEAADSLPRRAPASDSGPSRIQSARASGDSARPPGDSAPSPRGTAPTAVAPADQSRQADSAAVERDSVAARDSAGARQSPTTRETPAGPPPRRWFTLWNTLSLWAFGLVFWVVYQARRRLVIATFEDFSNKQAGMDVGGFGVLVAAELAGLGELFAEFEAGSSLEITPGGQAELRATFQTESASQFLERAITSETSFAVGPLKVPVGIFLGLLGRLVQGPVLNAQVHRDGDHRVVTARLGDRTFRLADRIVSGAGDQLVWRPAREVARELACRVFSEIAMEGAVTWRALDCFAHAVRAYRDSLRAPQVQQVLWHEAEHRLLRAIAEDPRFDLAYYDLGVVFNQQGKLDAADIAFARAIAAHQGPGRWSAHYALAFNTFHRVARAGPGGAPRVAIDLHLSRALNQCDQALSLAPDAAARARILSLKATVLLWRGGRMPATQPAARMRAFSDAGLMARRAVWKGWRALCRAELGLGSTGPLGATRLQARALASQYLQDLATIAAVGAKQRHLLRALRSVGGLSEAARLDQQAAAVQRDLEASKAVPASQTVWRRALLRLALLMARLARGANRLGDRLQGYDPLIGMLLRVAARTLRQARRLTPESAGVHLALGEVYLEQHRPGAARKALWTAVRLEPASAHAWALLARACAERLLFSELDEAVRRFFENPHKASPDSFAALATALDAHAAAIARWQRLADELRQRARAPFPRLWGTARFLRDAYQMAERNLTALRVGAEQRRALLQNPNAFDDRLDAIRRIRDRLEQFPSLQGKIEQLVQEGQDGLAGLESLLAEQIAAGHGWEVAETGYQLFALYRAHETTADILAKEEEALRRTLEHLEATLPGEIQQRGLYAQLSRVLRRLGKVPAALEQARIAVSRDPLSAFERVELGWVHYHLSEFPAAQAAWEDAVRLAPDNPHNRMNLALAYLMELSDLKDRATRAARAERAAEQLHTALDLLGQGDPERDRAQYLLSTAHAEAGRRDDAVRELRALDRRDYCDLAVSLHLAEAHLVRDDWGEAEHMFGKAVAEAEALAAAASGGVNEPIKTPTGESMVAGSAAAWGRLGVAATLIEREIGLDQARAHIDAATAVIQKLADADLKRRWLGNIRLQEGALLLRQDRVDDAIGALEEALAIEAYAGTYLLLANALTRKGELAAAEKRAPFLRRGARYYDEAQRRDWTGALEPRIAAGRRELEALTAAAEPGGTD
jgi:tetratricopeptide (TPR) repeat protein